MNEEKSIDDWSKFSNTIAFDSWRFYYNTQTTQLRFEWWSKTYNLNEVTRNLITQWDVKRSTVESKEFVWLLEKNIRNFAINHHVVSFSRNHEYEFWWKMSFFSILLSRMSDKSISNQIWSISIILRNEHLDYSEKEIQLWRKNSKKKLELWKKNKDDNDHSSERRTIDETKEKRTLITKSEHHRENREQFISHRQASETHFHKHRTQRCFKTLFDRFFYSFSFFIDHTASSLRIIF
jgi:hypothetical protein